MPDRWDDFPGPYRRLLPRVLRRVVLDGSGPHPAVVASRLPAVDPGGRPERAAVDRWLERRPVVRSGRHDACGATPAELAQWLLTLDPDFLGAHRLQEVGRIAWSRARGRPQARGGRWQPGQE
ncbi:hypothetical protein [Kitasatospora phosalacinea]|uniref:Uncharacterized protein n=1 Tax=Kitasatospora phosalacinea TaxID=2065 RepID=A0ABW6GR35_9ACTN